jgi:hypothetical protein
VVNILFSPLFCSLFPSFLLFRQARKIKVQKRGKKKKKELKKEGLPQRSGKHSHDVYSAGKKKPARAGDAEAGRRLHNEAVTCRLAGPAR